jgi:hypothetical protein
VWDVQKQVRLHQLTVSSGEVRVLGFLDHGQGLATIHLEERPVPAATSVRYVEFSKLAIVCPEAVCVHEWDLSTGRETRTWQGRWPADTFSVAQSADERWLLALGLTGSIWLGDRLTGGEALRQLGIGLAGDAAFSWDGKRFAAANFLGREEGTKVWDTATLREIAAFRIWSVSVAFSLGVLTGWEHPCVIKHEGCSACLDGAVVGGDRSGGKTGNRR